MIAKSGKGKGFRGAVDYDLAKGHVIDKNMAGENPRELAAEFGEIRRLRPNLGKAVLHVSLSAAPGEMLTDAQWRQVAQRYLVGMGFDNNNQYVCTRHTDTAHEHVHLLVNRIRIDTGQVVSDSQDYQRQETLMRVIEQEFGLQTVAPSSQAGRKAPTRDELEMVSRTGTPSVRQRLQQLADTAAHDCRGFSQFQQRLEAAGVELVPVVQLAGAKLSGLSYRLLDGGELMKGSDLGKGYSPAGLAKRGVTYQQDQDYVAVRRCLERAPGVQVEAAVSVPSTDGVAAGDRRRADEPGRAPHLGPVAIMHLLRAPLTGRALERMAALGERLRHQAQERQRQALERLPVVELQARRLAGQLRVVADLHTMGRLAVAPAAALVRLMEIYQRGGATPAERHAHAVQQLIGGTDRDRARVVAMLAPHQAQVQQAQKHSRTSGPSMA